MDKEKKGRAWILLIMATIALSGCERLADAFKDSALRINEAFPASAETINAVTRLEQLLAADASTLDAFRTEYSSKQKVRALTCAEGFEPSLLATAQDIRNKLNKADCFIRFDSEQARVLNLKRASILANSPPLRAIPDNPVSILTASRPIVTAIFANKAGVGLFASNDALEIIDVGNDRSIYLDSEPDKFVFHASLSPNGRLFSAISQQNGGQGARIRDAETGEVLADYPDIQRFEWLDASTAWITRRNERGSELFDLRTGKTFPLKGISSVPTQILKVPSEEEIFIARSGNMLSRFTLKYESGEPQINLISQQSTPYMNWSAGVSAISSGGRYMVQGAGTLTVSDLDTAETQQISLAPYSALSISTLPDPDQMLLTILSTASGRSDFRPYIFHLSDHTFSKVDEGTIAINPPRSLHTAYIPSLNRVGLISDSTVKLLDVDIKRGFKLGPQALLQYLSEQDAEVAQSLAAKVAETYRTASLVGASGVASSRAGTGDLREIARTAQIEAVGVYRSDAASSQPGREAGRGPVSVLVRSSPKPIVLVLSSYDPVDWRIQLAPGAELKAVLFSSYSSSTVQGTGAVRVLQMGRGYAYDRNSANFGALQRDVMGWTGKPIETFQGTYQARNFTVGGK